MPEILLTWQVLIDIDKRQQVNVFREEKEQVLLVLDRLGGYVTLTGMPPILGPWESSDLRAVCRPGVRLSSVLYRLEPRFHRLPESCRGLRRALQQEDVLYCMPGI